MTLLMATMRARRLQEMTLLDQENRLRAATTRLITLHPMPEKELTALSKVIQQASMRVRLERIRLSILLRVESRLMRRWTRKMQREINRPDLRNRTR